MLGGSGGRSASPAYYNAFTVGDMLKAQSPASRVVGVSFKDRAAILMGGRQADAAYWYETADGRFVLITQSAMDMSGGDHADMNMDHGGNSVAVIDVAAQEIVRFIPVGAEPSGIGTRPGS